MRTQYRIKDVSADGFMTVQWGDDETGLEVTYPIPLDGDGAVLDGDALEDWFAVQWEADIAAKFAPGPDLAALKARRSASFTALQPALDRRRQSE